MTDTKRLARAASALLMAALALAVSGCADQTTDAPGPAPTSVINDAYRAWLASRTHALSLGGDTLMEYAAKCDVATQMRVPAFNCDQGTLVPQQDLTNGLCNKPNVLNGRCDPGSRFKVLVRTDYGAVVANCRKDTSPTFPVGAGQYNDIAVIQYNKNNGAVCFYQALGYQNGPLDGTNISSPSQGAGAWSWLDPDATAGANCTACHDSGGFVRSEYVAQLMSGPDAMPTTGSGFDNNTTPLKYVGTDFKLFKSWSVTAPPATCPPGQACLPCNGCHRLAVNNTNSESAVNASGTAARFSLIATAQTQSGKTPHSSTSPIWMRPGQIVYTAEAEASAKNYSDCANGYFSSSFTTVPPGCTVTPLGTTWTGLSPAQVVHVATRMLRF